MTRANDALATELGRPATIAELAARLDVTEEQVLDARQAVAAHSPASLDERLNESDDAATLGELLGADDPAMANVENSSMLDGFLRQLPERERQILRLRFQEDFKQREIGDLVGVSQMHVSRCSANRSTSWAPSPKQPARP